MSVRIVNKNKEFLGTAHLPINLEKEIDNAGGVRIPFLECYNHYSYREFAKSYCSGMLETAVLYRTRDKLGRVCVVLDGVSLEKFERMKDVFFVPSVFLINHPEAVPDAA